MSEIGADVGAAGEVSFDAPVPDMDTYESIETVDFNDEGKLTVYYKDEQPAEQPAAEASAEPEPAAPAAPEQSAVPAIDYEKRYNDLRSEFDRRNQVYAQAERILAREQGRQEALRQRPREAPKPAEKVDPFEVLADPDRFEAYVVERAQRLLDERLAPHREALIEVDLTRELRDCASRYGEDFLARREQISAVFEMFPDVEISYERAYQIARRLNGDRAPAAAPVAEPRPPQGTPAATAKEPPSRKVPLEDLQASAARLRPETGVAAGGSVTEPKEEASSWQEAVNLTMRELGIRR